MNATGCNFRMAWVSLRDAWRRNLLSLCGLAVGVSAVVAMIALTMMVRREALSQFDDTGMDVLAIRNVTEANGANRPALMDLETVRHLGQAQPALERIVPVGNRRAAVMFSGREYETDVLGVTGDYFDLHALGLAEGRALSVFDRFASYAVIGHGQAQRLRAGGQAALLGANLTVNGRVFTIVGVLKPAKTIRLQKEQINDAVLIPVTTFERVFVNAAIEVIYARHRAGAVMKDVADEAADYLQMSVPGLTVQVTSAAELVAEMQHQLKLFTLLLGAVGTLSLVLGGAGIMNSLMLTVAERKAEVGLRRALGALRGDVQSQFLIESFLLCAAGGLAGMLFGLVVTRVVSSLAGWVFYLSPLTLITGVALVAIVGLVVGYFPAAQAARLDPASAMKDD